MAKYILSILGSVFLGVTGILPAMALPSNASMRDDGYALAPFSFTKFCIDYPGDCPSSGGQARVQMTAPRLAQLSEVNRSVNASIRPMEDTSKLRYWHLNVAAGDCNSFAIQKRHELLALGWPAGALALTVAQTSWGEGHLVVTVRTDQGDLVLDNLRSKIISWQQTGYHFIMRQSGSNPQFWVELHGGHIDQQFAARQIDDEQKSAEPSAPKSVKERNVSRMQTATLSAPRYRNNVSARGSIDGVTTVALTIPDLAAVYGTLDAAANAIHEAENNQIRLTDAADRIRQTVIADWLRVSRMEPIIEIVAVAARFILPTDVAGETSVHTVAALERPFDPTAFGFI